jgi:NADPH2:quinone reductase
MKPPQWHDDVVTGQRVIISQLGTEPLQAIEQFATLQPMEPPDPATLGPRDVVVRVASAAVGWVDLLMSSGQYQHVPEPPYTPGLEYAGTVHWAGAEANLAVGARVLVDPFLAGPRSLGAYRQYGGFATYAVAPAEAVLPMPGALSFDQACNLLGNYETAYHCLVARGRLAAGETVLVHGASGSVGLAAVHVAKLLGATVIATGRNPAKLDVVRAQGADHVVASLRARPCRFTAPRARPVSRTSTSRSSSVRRSLRRGGTRRSSMSSARKVPITSSCYAKVGATRSRR